MADKKISELTALTSTASGDLFAVVDASATETKYVTRDNIFGQTLFVNTSSDRVGFNTSSPQATAHIIGSGGAVSSAAYVGASDLIIEDTVHANIHLISNATNGITSIYFGDPDDADVGYIAYFHNSNAMQLKTNGTVALTIDSAGLLNFGTHSAIGAETVTGYITIKDSGGTSRKLAVVS